MAPMGMIPNLKKDVEIFLATSGNNKIDRKNMAITKPRKGNTILDTRPIFIKVEMTKVNGMTKTTIRNALVRLDTTDK